MGYKFNLRDDVIPRFKEECLIFTWGGRGCEGVFHFRSSAEKENAFNGKQFPNFSEITLKGDDSCTFQDFFATITIDLPLLRQNQSSCFRI